MNTCEYKYPSGKLCKRPTNESATLNGRIVYFCPEHKLPGAEQVTGRPFKEPPKPKA